ncbi:MAG: methylenetetrahydrofolate reductase [Clostridia bacterium]|nr:methylenetetrahydrofolate reductase [NAD(P)H] [Clostridia bacterium]
MKIIDIINGGKPTISMEVFPPKTNDKFNSIKQATEEIAALKPDFMSVTYGAGGGTSEFTAEIAENIQNKYGVPTLAHLTCLSSDKQKIETVLSDLQSKGIENVLALRGDIPQDFDRSKCEFHYASELIGEIKAKGDFCIGGACYPETHPESATSMEDIANLKIKVDSGCSFLTTQMFFDNNILYNFMYRVREAGIQVPIVAGIMPVTNAVQLRRIRDISGSQLPSRFIRIVDRYGDNPLAMKQAGIAFAVSQIIDLFANGVNSVHVYTMNKPEVAKAIMDNISYIIR